MANIDDLYEIGYSQLNEFQRDILNECYTHTGGGLSLPMGSGKTIISLVMGLHYMKLNKNPMLILVSKTLINNWIFEINKFFGDTLKYQVLHSEYINDVTKFVIHPNTHLVLTTPDVTYKLYSENNIKDKLVHGEFINLCTYYNKCNAPFGGDGPMYSLIWSSIFIDEIQKFTNIKTERCRSIVALCSKYKWGLSGTMFDEPKTERILGYYLIINHPNFPRSLPDAEKYITSQQFNGVSNTIVKRDVNLAFVEPVLDEIIIEHEMCAEEKIIYLCMKDTLKEINRKINKLKILKDEQSLRVFQNYMFTMINHLRQCVVCPLLPIANISLDSSNFDEKNELSELILNVIKKKYIDNWLDDENSVLSSRLRNVLNVIDKHNDEKIVIFFSFRMCLDIMAAYIKRPCYTLVSELSLKARDECIKQFNASDRGVLMTTYNLGAEGLNIQSAHIVLLVDLWWNAAKTKQAIARVFRFGQQSPVVKVYYFTSNTGIEHAILDKHIDKVNALSELQTGSIKTNIKLINISNIIKILDVYDNALHMTKLNKLS